MSQGYHYGFLSNSSCYQHLPPFRGKAGMGVWRWVYPKSQPPSSPIKHPSLDWPATSLLLRRLRRSPCQGEGIVLGMAEAKFRDRSQLGLVGRRICAEKRSRPFLGISESSGTRSWPTVAQLLGKVSRLLQDQNPRRQCLCSSLPERMAADEG